MDKETKPPLSEHKIGSSTYLLGRFFKQDATEDATAKMKKIVQKEVQRLHRNHNA